MLSPRFSHAEAVLQLGGLRWWCARYGELKAKSCGRRGTGIVVTAGKVRIRTNRNILGVSP